MMFEDATGAKGLSDSLPVQDLAELVEASLRDGGPVAPAAGISRDETAPILPAATEPQ
jgi:hypothetical protein